MINLVDIMIELKVGCYVSFDLQNIILYKVLEIDFENKYIKIYDNDVGSTWEKIEYIERVFYL